ncbi:MAG: hypothetical protein AB7H96_22935 [Vicinamibacterales bacterium]
MTSEHRHAIITRAATRLALADEGMAPADSGRVTVADLADYARSRPARTPTTALRSALRADPALREALDRLLDHYATIGIPKAMAASSGPIGRRRQAEMGVEVEWAESSVEPNTLIVRVLAPPRMRPVHELVLRGDDGDLQSITFIDEGEEVEALIDRRSAAYVLLSADSSKLWLR